MAMMKAATPYQTYEAENCKRRMCAYYNEGWRYKPPRINKADAHISNIHAIITGGMSIAPCYVCCCDNNGQYTGEPVPDKVCKRARLIRGAMPEPKNPVATE